MATEDENTAIIERIKAMDDNILYNISYFTKGKLIEMVKFPTTMIDENRLQRNIESLPELRKNFEENVKKFKKILEDLKSKSKTSTSKGGKRKSRRRVRKNTLTKRRYRKYI